MPVKGKIKDGRYIGSQVHDLYVEGSQARAQAQKGGGGGGGARVVGRGEKRCCCCRFCSGGAAAGGGARALEKSKPIRLMRARIRAAGSARKSHHAGLDTVPAP